MKASPHFFLKGHKMAKPLKPEDGDNKSHNIAAINAAINKWAKARLAKEDEIEKAHKLYIADLKSDLSFMDKNIKNDSGVTLKVLKANYKLLKIQHDAKTQLDETQADELLVTMRVAFDALSQGGQLDFIDAAETSEETPALKAVK